jgi:hypothetical protein
MRKILFLELKILLLYTQSIELECADLAEGVA